MLVPRFPKSPRKIFREIPVSFQKNISWRLPMDDSLEPDIRHSLIILVIAYELPTKTPWFSIKALYEISWKFLPLVRYSKFVFISYFISYSIVTPMTLCVSTQESYIVNNKCFLCFYIYIYYYIFYIYVSHVYFVLN